MLNYILALCPSPVHVLVRRLMGAKIGKGVRLRFGTFLNAKSIALDEGVSIGPFSYIVADSLTMGKRSRFRTLTFCRASKVQIGEYVHVGALCVITSTLNAHSRMTIGDHSLFGPFCWFEAGEGIDLGKHVGIGGHVRMFTHGSWPDYLRGGINAYGPVTVEDEAWIAWDSFVMPNVVVGKGAIVGAASVVTKSIGANAIAVGSPARILGAPAMTPIDSAEKIKRAKRMLSDFAEFRPIRGASSAPALADGRLSFGPTISIDSSDGLRDGDLLFLVTRTMLPDERESLVKRGITVIDHETLSLTRGRSQPYVDEFVAFVRRYGVRLHEA